MQKYSGLISSFLPFLFDPDSWFIGWGKYSIGGSSQMLIRVLPAAQSSPFTYLHSLFMSQKYRHNAVHITQSTLKG